MSILNLPLDLLVEILTRLPVKSLIHLTIVCKSWFSLIRRREFVLKHLNFQPTLSKDCSNYLVTWRDPKDPDHHVVRFSMLSFDHVASFGVGQKLKWYLMYQDPFHGVFLISSRGFMALWNPAIRELSSVPLSIGMLQRKSFYCGALGFDPMTDDYKVVVIHYDNSESNCSTVEVYSVCNNSWHPASGSFHCPMPRLGCESPVLNGNGRICSWLSPFDCDYIISFDMTKEHLVETPLPCQERTHKHVLIQSNEYQARLCCTIDIIHCQQDNNGLCLWVLDGEYGDGATWIKWLSFRTPDLLVANAKLRFWGDDRVAFLISVSKGDSKEGEKFLYDPLTQRLIRTRSGGPTYGLGYKESLVSIKALQKQHGIEPSPLLPQLGGCDVLEYLIQEADKPFISEFFYSN